MAVRDQVSDLLTRIRNAQMALHESLELPHSRQKEAIVEILAEEGYIGGYKLNDAKDSPFRTISILLKYTGEREPAIRQLKRISKPGRRVYVGSDEIPEVLNGLGINVLSTSKGVLTGKAARREGVGGELLFEVY
ncbi:MAG TPA: 30S ribosomal protein S8 [Acidobacteriota bacterium]|nr:30S ribosomal protein S8 [Acidobacteriota bacterium]